MVTQTGPRLTVVGSCEGCEHLRHVERRYDGDEHTYRITVCAHEKAQRNNAGEPMAMHDSGGPNRRTPPTCPELPAARLALARSVVAEAPCQVSLVRQTGGNLPCIVKGEHVEHRSACGRAWGGDTFVDHPDFDSRAFCDDGSEAQ